MSLWLLPALLAGVTTAPPPGQSDEARAVVERAIEAHGGAALDRYPAGKDTIKGVIVVDDQEIEVEGSSLFSLPGRNKTVITINLGGMKQTFTQVINDGRATLLIDGKATELPDDELTDLRHAQHASDIFRLTLLVKDSDYSLKSLGEQEFDGRPMVGVLVKHKKQKDVKVWFDKKTGLVARMERKTLQEGQEKQKVLLYSEYREFGGVKFPCREVILIEGKKTQDIRTTDRKPMEKVPDKEFAADE